MKNYNFRFDLKLVRKYLNLSQEEFGRLIGVNRVSVSRYETGLEFPGDSTLESFYSFCYSNKAKLGDFNQIKIQYLEDDKKQCVLLFHGAKDKIKGAIDIFHSKAPVDLGSGFYAGEKYSQASTWVANYPKGSVYCYYANLGDLKGTEITVEEKWMIAILYYRGRLREYSESPKVKSIIDDLERCDYIKAPIADNNMYQTLEEFGHRRITDEQCFHALSATNLGRQYVFRTEVACEKLVFADRIYLCKEEKKDCLKEKSESDANGIKKAQMAIEKYRRKGRYIDELFK